MQQLPDIKSLYQRKYIQSSHLSQEYDSGGNPNCVYQRAQRFHQRLIAPSPNKKPNCIKIIKEKSNKFRVDSHEKTQQQSHPIIRRYSSNHNDKFGHSSSTYCPKNELIRQVMKISQQELSDLQSSLGGEKTLMSLFSVFFERRHQLHELNRTQCASSVRPMRNQSTRYKEGESKSQRQRVNKQQLGAREQDQLKMKELAPWSVRDMQFP